jgi:hypothetical protein
MRRVAPPIMEAVVEAVVPAGLVVPTNQQSFTMEEGNGTQIQQLPLQTQATTPKVLPCYIIQEEL